MGDGAHGDFICRFKVIGDRHDQLFFRFGGDAEWNTTYFNGNREFAILRLALLVYWIGNLYLPEHRHRVRWYVHWVFQHRERLAHHQILDLDSFLPCEIKNFASTACS